MQLAGITVTRGTAVGCPESTSAHRCSTSSFRSRLLPSWLTLCAPYRLERWTLVPSAHDWRATRPPMNLHKSTSPFYWPRETTLEYTVKTSTSLKCPTSSYPWTGSSLSPRVTNTRSSRSALPTCSECGLHGVWPDGQAGAVGGAAGTRGLHAGHEHQRQEVREQACEVHQGRVQDDNGSNTRSHVTSDQRRLFNHVHLPPTDPSKCCCNVW